MVVFILSTSENEKNLKKEKISLFFINLVLKTPGKSAILRLNVTIIEEGCPIVVYRGLKSMPVYFRLQVPKWTREGSH